MSKDVWSLEVFRRAYALSLDVHRTSLGFPKNEQYGGVADQLRRSSKSVCALLAEGAGRRTESESEFRRYVVMALGSVEEAKLWCAYARDLGYAEISVALAWQGGLEEVARMLQGLLKRLTAS
jgi:four helix bundle protein